MAEKKSSSGDLLLDGGTARDNRRDVPDLKVPIKGEEVPPENDGKKSLILRKNFHWIL